MSGASDRRDWILDSIRIGIVCVDSLGRAELLNAEASRILGVSADVTAGRSGKPRRSPR